MVMVRVRIRIWVWVLGYPKVDEEGVSRHKENIGHRDGLRIYMT
jgi:hypothetical protein